MNYAHIFIASQVVILALCVLIPICKAIGRSAKEAREGREAEERQAEAERSAAQRKAEAEAKAAEAERRRAIRKAEADAKRAERLEAARQLAEYKRQTLEAERETRALKNAPQAAAPCAAPRRPIIRGNMAFRGQTVAFTGTLKGWKRREAIQAVADNGGRAFEDMPAGTTILIVGDKPGKTKLDKARKWGVRILTESDFETYLHMQLTLTPDEFAALYAA